MDFAETVIKEEQSSLLADTIAHMGQEVCRNLCCFLWLSYSSLQYHCDCLQLTLTGDMRIQLIELVMWIMFFILSLLMMYQAINFLNFRFHKVSVLFFSCNLRLSCWLTMDLLVWDCFRSVVRYLSNIYVILNSCDSPVIYTLLISGVLACFLGRISMGSRNDQN